MSQRERTRQRQQAKTNAEISSDHFGPSMRNIDLTIDELILDGVPAAQRYQIANAVQRELAAQFEREGLPKTLGSPVRPFRDVVDGGTMPLVSGTRAETIGGQLAGAIYQGITNATAPRGK